MMVALNALVIVVCLVACFALGYALFLPVWLAVAWLTGRRGKWRLTLASLPVYAIAFLTVFGGLFWWTSRPHAVYERTFGFAPSGDVQDLQSSAWSLGDSGYTYLTFTADPATIDHIVARGLVAIHPSPAELTADANAPEWWTPAPDQRIQVYRADFTGRYFHSVEEEVLYFNPDTGRTFFRYRGID